VAAAGELGIGAGVLPWPAETAENAVSRMFHEWLAARGTTGATDLEAGVRQMRLFLEQYGTSRFEDEANPRPIVARAGYVRKLNDGSLEYLFLIETFKSEVCKGYSAESIASELARRGFLIRGEQDRLTSRVRIGTDTTADNRVSVYRISGRLLSE